MKNGIMQNENNTPVDAQAETTPEILDRATAEAQSTPFNEVYNNMNVSDETREALLKMMGNSDE